MRRIILYFFISFILTQHFNTVSASKIDSLQKVLAGQKDDSLKVKTLWKLSIINREVSNETSMNYAIDGLNLSRQINWNKGVCFSHLLIGETYSYHGDFTHGIEMLEKVLDCKTDTLIVIKAINGIANAHQNSGNYSEAYLWNKKCLALARQARNSGYIAASLGNIGSTYLFFGEYSKALDYYLQARKIFEETGNMRGMSSCYGNIALIHDYMGDLEKAMEYNQKSLEIDLKTERNEGIAAIYGNMALLFQKQRLYDSSYIYHRKSLLYYKKINFELEATRELMNLYNLNEFMIDTFYRDNHKERDKRFVLLMDSIKQIMPVFIKANDKMFGTILLITLAQMQIKLKEFKKAERNLEMGLQFAKDIKSKSKELDFYGEFVTLYRQQKKHEKVAEYLEKYLQTYKATISEKTAADIAGKDLLFDFNKKVMADSLKNEADKKLKDEEIKMGQLKLQQERIIQYALFGGLAIVLLFSILLFKRFRITAKQKAIIENQKKLVEEKQEAIVDSINYARRIQKAFMSNENYIAKKLKDLRK